MVRYSLTKSSSPQPAGLGPVPPVRSAVAFTFEIKFTINTLCLNYPKTIPHSKSVEKLSSTKPVHGAKKVGDCRKNKSKAGVSGGRQLELKASVKGLQ